MVHDDTNEILCLPEKGKRKKKLIKLYFKKSTNICKNVQCTGRIKLNYSKWGLF